MNNILFNVMSNPIQCSICLIDLKKDIKVLSCKHEYHKKCIDAWLTNNNTCPLCRETIILPIPKITILPINNHQNLINNNQNIINNHPFQFSNKFKKNILTFLYILTVFFFIGSVIYHTISIFQTNNYINNIIKDYNETELNNHNSNTLSGEVLIIIDVLILFIYIISNIAIINKMCGICLYMFYVIISIIILVIHGSFQTNTINYLNDDVLDIFNKNYYDNCIFSMVLFGSSFGINIVVLVISMTYIHLELMN